MSSKLFDHAVLSVKQLWACTPRVNHLQCEKQELKFSLLYDDLYCEIKGMMRGTCTACWLEAEASSCTVKIIQILLTTVRCPLLAPDQLTYVLTGMILGHVVSWDVKSSAPLMYPGPGRRSQSPNPYHHVITGFDSVFLNCTRKWIAQYILMVRFWVKNTEYKSASDQPFW